MLTCPTSGWGVTSGVEWYHSRRRDTGERKTEMPKRATVHIDDAELKMKETASPDKMERRRAVAKRLRSLMDRPMTEAEKEFWREFETELENNRLAFR